jgi:hypothetical protein
LEWTLKPSLLNLRLATNDAPAEQVVDGEEIAGEATGNGAAASPMALEAAEGVERTPGPPFPTLTEFAKALNRLDPTALELAAGDPSPHITIDGLGIKQLIGTFWFRSIFPRLSASWRERLLDTLAASIVIPNHVLSRGRHALRLADASYDDLKAIAATTTVNGAAGADLQLVLAIGSLWGEEARRRLRFVEVAPEGSSRLGALLGLRR